MTLFSASILYNHFIVLKTLQGLVALAKDLGGFTSAFVIQTLLLTQRREFYIHPHGLLLIKSLPKPFTNDFNES